VPMGDECRPRTMRSGSVTANLAKFGFQCLFVKATGVEVLSWRAQESSPFQVLAGISPNRRSHQVQRISALRDRFWGSWRRGQCSAHPA
jgi:hypothetical protein